MTGRNKKQVQLEALYEIGKVLTSVLDLQKVLTLNRQVKAPKITNSL